MALAPTPQVTARGVFDATGILSASPGSGVYELFRGKVLLVIGRSSDLLSDLEAHLRGERGAQTRCATSFQIREIASSEVLDCQSELLATYRRSNNSNVPVGNRSDVMPEMATQTVATSNFGEVPR